MKTIKDVLTVEIEVKPEELFQKKWLNAILLSEKLKQKELEEQTAQKAYRVRFYNTLASDRFNTCLIAGIKCIDIDSPMKNPSLPASIVLQFKRV